MKKFLLSLAMGMTANGASAQNTFNVRVGGAYLYEWAAFTTMTQANIPLNHHGSWTLSPAVQIAATGNGSVAGMLHANMGYRTRIANNWLFAPKVGVAGGYSSLQDFDDAWLVGPSIDLTFEYKHFVIGLTGFYSIPSTSSDQWPYWEYDSSHSPLVSLTLGYTF